MVLENRLAIGNPSGTVPVSGNEIPSPTKRTLGFVICQLDGGPFVSGNACNPGSLVEWKLVTLSMTGSASVCASAGPMKD